MRQITLWPFGVYFSIRLSQVNHSRGSQYSISLPGAITRPCLKPTIGAIPAGSPEMLQNTRQNSNILLCFLFQSIWFCPRIHQQDNGYLLPNLPYGFVTGRAKWSPKQIVQHLSHPRQERESKNWAVRAAIQIGALLFQGSVRYGGLNSSGWSLSCHDLYLKSNRVGSVSSSIELDRKK